MRFLSLVVLILVATLYACGSGPDHTATPPVNVVTTQLETVVQPAQEVLPYRELESYPLADYVKRNIVIRSGITNEDLTRFAQALYRQYPKQRFQIFDDDAQFREYELWDIHYVKDDSAFYPAPEQWFEQHLRASILPTMNPNGPGKRWAITLWNTYEEIPLE